MGEALCGRAVALMLKPSFNDPRIARTRLSGMGQRPDRFEVRRSPAMILSRMRLRSSSANTPSIPNMARPALVEVSRPCWCR